MLDSFAEPCTAKDQPISGIGSERQNHLTWSNAIAKLGTERLDDHLANKGSCPNFILVWYIRLHPRKGNGNLGSLSICGQRVENAETLACLGSR